MRPLATFVLLVTCALAAASLALAQGSIYRSTKLMAFRDPRTGFIYSVESRNVTQMTTGSTIRSIIKISRINLDSRNSIIEREREYIQTINFHPTLVDFDLHCQADHCYMVAVTSRSKQNVELYSWQRTQFDRLVVRDSFARPHSVKIMKINQSFYIAVAQEQLHLMPYRLAHNDEFDEQARFIGCAVLKFTKGHEKTIKYHQFIRLPFNPLHVDYFTSYQSESNQTASAIIGPTPNHHLVFSVDRNWAQANPSQSGVFIWVPLNDYFWPYRLPRGAEFSPVPKPNVVNVGPVVFKIKTAPPPHAINLTQPADYVAPVESCFYQLERLLAERDQVARKSMEMSRTVWRSQDGRTADSLTNITAQVIVYGNVDVRGSLIESPQISLISHPRQPIELITKENIAKTTRSHSPLVIENKLKQALYKLKHIREKLTHAIPGNQPGVSIFNSQIRFLGPLHADEVIFKGVSNSNVRLNGIPFDQLEHELVSLNGPQNIGARVVFLGKVVADVLEIHSLVNDQFFMKDAIDITSNRVQVIDVTGHNYVGRNDVALRFSVADAPELILSHNASFNQIHLADFITRDQRTQLVYGRKIFKRLSMGKLELADRDVQLNGFNLSRIATEAIRLRGNPNSGSHQFINGKYATFARPIRATRLSINNVINQHINLTSLIYDSVKTNEPARQQISGHKRFLNGLKIARLSTDGSINGVQINQVFNLNSMPPLSEHSIRYNGTNLIPDVPITGQFKFRAPVTVYGNLNTGLVNGVDLARHAVRRFPVNQSEGARIQFVRGHKTFGRPIRVLDRVDLVDARFNLSQSTASRPLINGVDLRSINAALNSRMQRPPPMFVDNLEIDGNLNLPMEVNLTASRVTLGNYSVCPLDVLRSKLLLLNTEEQFIDLPIRVDSLRVRSVFAEPRGLNGISFPDDFVLKSAFSHRQNLIEPIYGHKSFEHLVVSPSLTTVAQNYSGRVYNREPLAVPPFSVQRAIVLDEGSMINTLNYAELQNFLNQEQRYNSTGEKVYSSLTVHGNLFAKRINGFYWPEDILLKSLRMPDGGPVDAHRRIYSPLYLANSSFLEVDNQLVLRGPVQLHGRMNGVNLTDFVRQSATYGDKDLMSINRPLRNKVFVGGLTIKGEVRAQGLIDGVNVEEMKNRVVTIGPMAGRRPIQINSPKAFLSDTQFDGPVRISYLNDLPLDFHLQRIKFEPDGQTIRVFGKKTITGSLRAKTLIVRGLINGHNFVELQDKAISLSPNQPEVKFNKTLTIEGDVFMDNLLINPNDGIIDGVRLGDLVRINNHKPMSILYEQRAPIRKVFAPPVRIQQRFTPNHLGDLRNRIVSLNLVKVSHHQSSDLVIGFIRWPLNNIEDFILPEEEESHNDHVRFMNSFLVLDQIDFPFQPTIYHLSVGVITNREGQNLTSVLSSVGGGPLSQLSILPIETPNQAMFLKVAEHSLFLLISQDYTRYLGKHAICPTYGASINSVTGPQELSQYERISQNGVGVHVYLFHALQNSSSLSSAYFDLYQTIDLPSIDLFEKFDYRGSTYVLAISRSTERIYLLLLRGYSGFQVVSHLEVPRIDYIKVMYTTDAKPMLIIYTTDGAYHLMESVVI